MIHEYNGNKKFIDTLHLMYDFNDELEGSFLPQWYKPSYYTSLTKWQFKEIRTKGLKQHVTSSLKNMAGLVSGRLQINIEMFKLDRHNKKSSKAIHLDPVDPDKLEQSRKLYDEALQVLPEKFRWRLFIDSEKHYLNYEDIFDVKEPGYKNAMLGALQHIRDTLNVRMDAKSLAKLHDICVDKVKDTTNKGCLTCYKPPHFLKGFCIGACYAFPWTISQEVLEEWKKEKLIHSAEYNTEDRTEYLASLKFSKKESYHIIVSQYTGVKDLRINALFDAYYKEIPEALSTNAKLIAIVRLCRALEILHAFPDGNQRTIVFSLLLKLLIENGFCPTILKEPAAFDGPYSLNELVSQVIDGMALYFDTAVWSNEMPKSLSQNGKFSWMLEDKDLLANASWQVLTEEFKSKWGNK